MNNNLKILFNDNTEITNENVKALSDISNDYNKITNGIRRNIDDIFNNFLRIAAYLYEAKEKQIYKWVEYQDIYDYAQNEFGLGKTSVKNYIQIAEKCLENDLEDENLRVGKLKEQYKDFSYSQLVELLTVSEIDLNKYTPEMSVRAIRKNKYKDKLITYFNDNFDLDNEDSLINNFIFELKIVFDINYPNEKFSFKKRFNTWSSNDCSLALQFYMNGKDRLFELHIELDYDEHIRYSFYGVGYICLYNYNEALKHAENIILSQAKKILDEKSKKEYSTEDTEKSQTSDQENEDTEKSQTSDQENVVVVENIVYTGSYSEFIEQSDFGQEATSRFTNIILYLFSNCLFEWSEVDYIVKIYLNDNYYISFDYSNDYVGHRFDFEIDLFETKDDKLIKKYSLKSLLTMIVKDLESL